MQSPKKNSTEAELRHVREFQEDQDLSAAEAAALRETGTPANIDGPEPIRRGSNEQTFTLERTGDLPLTFTGERLTHAAPTEEFKERWWRWFELSVYRTKGGKYVCAMAYHTRYHNETEVKQAEVADDPEACAQVFADWGEEDHVIGWPAGSSSYRRKQKPMLRAMEDHWDAMMGQALKVPGFAERVD